MSWLTISFFVGSVIYSQAGSFTGRKSQKDLIEKILRGYDVNDWPHFYYGKRTDVHVQLFINAFGSPNAATMDFRLDLFLRQTWQDPRLAYSDKREHITILDREMQKKIWTPDTYFENVKESKIHQVTVPNVLLRVGKFGDIFYSMRLTLTVMCDLQLRFFPFDSQICSIELYSLGSTRKQLAYHWHDDPLRKTSDLQVAEFDLLDNKTVESLMVHRTGNYSGLIASFSLRRQNKFHLLQTYIPTILIVGISWVSFWLDPTAIPGRVTLGVTTLLTLTTLAAGVRQSLPPVSYIKAIDVWIGSCLVMVFGALMEFTVSNWLANKKRPFAQRMKTENGTPPYRFLPPTYIREARNLDRCSRAIFPGVFILFNMFYWPYYILMQYVDLNKMPSTFNI